MSGYSSLYLTHFIIFVVMAIIVFSMAVEEQAVGCPESEVEEGVEGEEGGSGVDSFVTMISLA